MSLKSWSCFNTEILTIQLSMPCHCSAVKKLYSMIQCWSTTVKGGKVWLRISYILAQPCILLKQCQTPPWMLPKVVYVEWSLCLEVYLTRPCMLSTVKSQCDFSPQVRILDGWLSYNVLIKTGLTVHDRTWLHGRSDFTIKDTYTATWFKSGLLQVSCYHGN